MKPGIQTRVSLGITSGVIVLSSVLLSALLYIYQTTFDEVVNSNAIEIDRGLTDQARKRALALTQMAGESLVNHMYFHQIDIISDFAESARRQKSVVYIYILDPAGEVIHDGTPTIESFGDLIQDGPQEVLRNSRTPTTWITDSVIHASAPVLIGSQILGSVRIGIDLSEVDQDKKSMQDLLYSVADKGSRSFLITSGIMVLLLGAISIGVGIAITRGTTADIASLKTVTEEIGKGRYETNFRIKRNDEIGDLGNAIRRMARELKENDEELRFVLAKAEAANRAKSEFLSSMSHELRTPMNAVLGFAEMLNIDHRESLSEKQQSFVNHILQSGKHLMELIDQLLELSKIEAGELSIKLEQVELRKVIDECLEFIQPRAQQEGIEILDRISRDNLPVLWTDPTRLTQVLLNLLSNAVKYNCKDGSVTLSCREVANNFLRISIADTGAGIPQEKQKDLFNSFDRLGREGGNIEGTGIGLTITKQLTELLAGKIGYQSEEGRGSTFWIDIPICRKLSTTE